MDSRILQVFVDDVEVRVPQGSTVLQSCEQLGITIPRFCYHDLLDIAGNCRICLVEIEKSPKPQASCSLPAIHQIRVYTKTPLVKKAQESVLEFLLLNHPLDCPICDQGGECDLQNYALNYGNLKTRFYTLKRGVEDKNLGPIVKTVITRCIHCTRCVRFASDIAGVEDLGTTLRGDHTEIGTYNQKTFRSELSGNLIDLCPVGALTSKTQAFQARPWELKSIQSIDTSDCLGSNINLEAKGTILYRIVPKPNKEINQDWLSDKARFMYEGQTSGRLAFPYFLKQRKYYPLKSKKKVKTYLNLFLSNYQNFNLILGRNLDLDTVKEGQNLSRLLGGDLEGETCFRTMPTIPASFQASLSLNNLSTLDFCLLLGVNPRKEASLFNLRLRNRFKACNLKVLTLGCSLDLTYPTFSIGLQMISCFRLGLGKDLLNLRTIRSPGLVYGDSLSIRDDFLSCLLLSLGFNEQKQKKDWFGWTRLPLGSNSIGKAFYGLSQLSLKNYTEDSQLSLYLLGLENTEKVRNLDKPNFKSIEETTHVSNLSQNNSFILPQQTVFEKTGYYINHSGFIQKNVKVGRLGTTPYSYLKKFSTYLKAKAYVALFLPAPIWNFSFLNQFKVLKPQRKIRKVKYLFKSLVSKSLIGFYTCCIKLKSYLTPLKARLDDPYCSDRCSVNSLTLNKSSGDYRQHTMFPFSCVFHLDTPHGKAKLTRV